MNDNKQTGKTALAAALAHNADYPYIKFMSAENLVNMSEIARCQKLTQVCVWT